MGQATVDLPDPSDLPPVDHVNPASVSAAALASADDLLSQLAGEDIDRLLAEAENAAQAPVVAPMVSPVIPKLPAVAEPAPAAAERTEVAAVAAAAEAGDAGIAVEAKEAEALQVMIEPPAAEPETPPIAPMAAPATGAMLTAPTETSASFETSAAEVAALFAPSAETAAMDDVANAGSPSLIVRLLQVINSPVSWISDAVRDAMGKVALLTLFNAVAVLVYVLVFRRHGR